MVSACILNLRTLRIILSTSPLFPRGHGHTSSAVRELFEKGTSVKSNLAIRSLPRSYVLSTARHLVYRMSYHVGSIEVLHRPTAPVDSAGSHYAGFQPSMTVLPAGHRKDEGCRAFPVSTTFERDVAIPMRDGTRLRADIFRPNDVSGKVPALLAWSPYGKSGAGPYSSFSNDTSRHH